MFLQKDACARFRRNGTKLKTSLYSFSASTAVSKRFLQETFCGDALCAEAKKLMICAFTKVARAYHRRLETTHARNICGDALCVEAKVNLKCIY